MNAGLHETARRGAKTYNWFKTSLSGMNPQNVFK